MSTNGSSGRYDDPVQDKPGRFVNTPQDEVRWLAALGRLGTEGAYARLAQFIKFAEPAPPIDAEEVRTDICSCISVPSYLLDRPRGCRAGLETKFQPILRPHQKLYYRDGLQKRE
jgi:hypothetical protein